MIYPGEMGEEEVAVLIGSAVLSLVLLLRWLSTLGASGWTVRPVDLGQRWPLMLTPFVALALLHVVLITLGDVYVQGDIRYQAQYDVLGFAWVMLANQGLGWTGLAAEHELVFRGNRAAALAGIGALLGLTAVYAGANVGDGPSWTVVVYAAGLGTVAWFVAWFVLAQGARAVEQVVVERHEGAGWRVGGLLFAIGLILGRSVAGDWASTDATLADLAGLGWFAGVLVAVEVAFTRLLPRPYSKEDPGTVMGGMVPAALYVLTALAYVLMLPHPNPVVGPPA